MALTDLGLIELNLGNPARAAALLEEALARVQQLGDHGLEAEALVGLGAVHTAAGDPRKATPLLQQAIVHARAAGERFTEKAAQERLGHAYGLLGDRDRCLTAFREALALARSCGTRQGVAEMLWMLGIVYGDLGVRADAVAHAQAAVEVLERLQHPHAAWYAEHLRRYRAGETDDAKARPLPLTGTPLFGATVVTATAPAAAPNPPPAPSLLRRAVSATQALARFLGSGLKIVPSAVLERRLRTCSACPHFTGLRCRLCGCFTNVKARLPHEECPLRKW
jgi:tetratricopeptide (TPR) repeat protein